MIFAAALLAAVSSSVPAVPNVPAVPSAPIPASVAQAKHHDFNRLDIAIYSGVVAYRVGDYWTTEHQLSRGFKETELPTALVDSKPAFLTYSLGLAAGEIAASYWLHKRGHAKIARALDTLSIGTGVATDVHNMTQKASAQ
jgi:hypothetical protein